MNFNRVFHEIDHPFWDTPIFGNTHIRNDLPRICQKLIPIYSSDTCVRNFPPVTFFAEVWHGWHSNLQVQAAPCWRPNPINDFGSDLMMLQIPKGSDCWRILQNHKLAKITGMFWQFELGDQGPKVRVSSNFLSDGSVVCSTYVIILVERCACLCSHKTCALGMQWSQGWWGLGAWNAPRVIPRMHLECRQCPRGFLRCTWNAFLECTWNSIEKLEKTWKNFRPTQCSESYNQKHNVDSLLKWKPIDILWRCIYLIWISCKIFVHKICQAQEISVELCRQTLRSCEAVLFWMARARIKQKMADAYALMFGQSWALF